MGSFRSVKLMSDGDGHDYLVPNDKAEAFQTVLELCQKLDDYDKFEELYSVYRIGGDVNTKQLYVWE